MASRANLLLLDEPTNHLDFATLEGFEAALGEFPGPVLAVSHDRRFIARFAGEVWGALRRAAGPARRQRVKRYPKDRMDTGVRRRRNRTGRPPGSPVLRGRR